MRIGPGVYGTVGCVRFLSTAEAGKAKDSVGTHLGTYRYSTSYSTSYSTEPSVFYSTVPNLPLRYSVLAAVVRQSSGIRIRINRDCRPGSRDYPLADQLPHVGPTRETRENRETREKTRADRARIRTQTFSNMSAWY